MPCNCDGYPEPRLMNPAEQWTSFSRHHKAMEIELEAYRDWARIALTRLSAVKGVFPDINISVPELPNETPSWTGQTYRDKQGEWPSDILEYCDWLDKKEDFGK